MSRLIQLDSGIWLDPMEVVGITWSDAQINVFLRNWEKVYLSVLKGSSQEQADRIARKLGELKERF